MRSATAMIQMPAVSTTEIRLFSDLHVFLEPGELTDGRCQHSFYRRNWDLARTDSFDRAA